MLTVRRIDEEGIPAIRRIAAVAFPATYRDLLSPGQLDYMMEWMYSEESLRGQFRAGHVWFVVSADGEPCGYVSVERQGGRLFHLHTIYALPRFQGIAAAVRLFRGPVAYGLSVCPVPRRAERYVNRPHARLATHHLLGLRHPREGDFPIGGGYWMNDYIMGLEIAGTDTDDCPGADGQRR